MGVLRGFALVIVAVLLFLSLLAMGVFATLSSSLTYENVQPRVYTIADNILTEEIGIQTIVTKLTPYLDVYCQNNSEIVQNFGNYTFVFPCSIVSEGYESILNYSVNEIVNYYYYKDYNCTFVECLEENDVPLFLVSDFSRTYWKSLFYKSFLIVLILSGLTFLLSQRKSNSLFLIGSLSIISSLLILKLENVGTFLSKIILNPISQAVSSDSSEEILTEAISMFFCEASKVFLWMFLAGIILIALGLFFRLTALGLKVKQKIEEHILRKKVEELEEKNEKLEEQIKQTNNKSQKSNQQKQKKKN